MNCCLVIRRLQFGQSQRLKLSATIPPSQTGRESPTKIAPTNPLGLPPLLAKGADKRRPNPIMAKQKNAPPKPNPQAILALQSRFPRTASAGVSEESKCERNLRPAPA